MREFQIVLVIKVVLSYNSSSSNPCMNLDPERTDRKWICLDTDGNEAGDVMGETEQEALTNYINAAAGASCFDRPIHTLVNGDTRLDVREVVNFHKRSNLPDHILVGSINAVNLDDPEE